MTHHPNLAPPSASRDAWVAYFAAHAPEPPEWFQPDLPKPPKFPDAQAILPYDQQTADWLNSWRRDPCYDIQEDPDWATLSPQTRELAREFVETVHRVAKERVAYDDAYKVERFFQWRLHYAREIAQRTAPVAAAESAALPHAVVEELAAALRSLMQAASESLACKSPLAQRTSRMHLGEAWEHGNRVLQSLTDATA